jgi:hypothetical protein
MVMARFPLKSSVIWSLAQYTPYYKSILIAGRGGQYDLGGRVGYFTTFCLHSRVSWNTEWDWIGL